MAGSFSLSLSRASEGIRSRVFPSSEKARARLRERERDEREMVGCEGSRRDNGAVLRGLFPRHPVNPPSPRSGVLSFLDAQPSSCVHPCSARSLSRSDVTRCHFLDGDNPRGAKIFTDNRDAREKNKSHFLLCLARVMRFTCVRARVCE